MRIVLDMALACAAGGPSRASYLDRLLLHKVDGQGALCGPGDRNEMTTESFDSRPASGPANRSEQLPPGLAQQHEPQFSWARVWVVFDKSSAMSTASSQDLGLDLLARLWSWPCGNGPL